MSDTNTNAGTAEATGSIGPVLPQTVIDPVAPALIGHSAVDMMNGFFTAIKHGAAIVYHDVLNVETRVHKWEDDNPLLFPFIDKALLFAEDVLAAHGIPVPAIAIAGQAVLSALKQMAANDATVQSGK